jgi:SAM-dependent methyltransferase
MPIEDAYRWDRRYQQDRQANIQSTRRFLVENQHFLPTSGVALDIAMGTGRNAAFLIEKGLGVVGVDISAVAVGQAKQLSPGIMAIVGDLTQLSFPDRVFDVILNFYYLQRNLWPDYRRMLRPGGVLYLETLTVGMLAIKPDTQAEFLLQPDELRQAFQDWNILVYQEGVVPSDHNQSKAVASLVARLPDD